MASPQTLSFSLIFFLSLSTQLISGAGLLTTTSADHPYKAEKLTHFRIYWHGLTGDAHPTSIPILSPKNNATFFVAMQMTDNPLTAAPEVTSKPMGRSQGFYAAASQEEIVGLMAMTFAFVEGKYNGSSITVMGRNPVMHKVREMPVVGGAGLFRFARGYVEARTHSLDDKTGDATVYRKERRRTPSLLREVAGGKRGRRRRNRRGGMIRH